MTKLINKAAIAALSFLFVAAFSPITNAAENPFGMSNIGTSQTVAAAGDGKCGEGKCGGGMAKKKSGKCGGDMKKKDGKCGGNMKKKDGKCGGDMKKKDGAKKGKCGEGKCGG